ncbi:unnamed protein product [Merluccius merluccius]
MENSIKRPPSKTRMSITITAQQPSHVKVHVPSLKFLKKKDLKADQSVTIQLPVKVQMSGSNKYDKTALVTATADVTVTSSNHEPYTGDKALVYPIQEWGTEYIVFTPPRRITYECPANSKYEQCGSACPATCSNPKAPKCTLPCVETCSCKEGFVLMEDKCLPAEDCGCTHQGHYLGPGQSVWADSDCQQRCTCNAKSRSVQCQAEACRAGTRCQVLKGIRDCHPISYSTCRATGDPHYVSFDNKKYNFQGTCVYQMAEHNGPVPFEVRVQNEHRGRKVVSFTRLLEVKVYNLSIVISKAYTGLVMVNGELANLPLSLAEGRVSVHKSGMYAVITTTFGLKVSFNWKSAVFVTLPSSFMGQVSGLCGNYNGKAEDDLIPKNGNTIVTEAEFGASWRVNKTADCEDDCEGVCPSCDIKKKKKYARNKFCEVQCPPNSHYEVCATACPANCQSLFSPLGCEEPCREGCSCQEGFVLSGERCVAASQCGCVHRERYYSPDQIFYPNGKCEEECKCNADGEQCVVKEGQAVCVPRTRTCWAWGDPHYRTFDGYRYNLQSNCSYIYSETCGDLQGLPTFLIAESNVKRSAVSFVSVVTVSVHGFNVSAHKEQHGQVSVNGELVDLVKPVQFGNGKLTVSTNVGSVSIETDFGLWVHLDWNWKLVVDLPNTYQGKVCGLCGNFNGIKEDELQAPGGAAVSTVEEWGQSWTTSC